MYFPLALLKINLSFLTGLPHGSPYRDALVYNILNYKIRDSAVFSAVVKFIISLLFYILYALHRNYSNIKERETGYRLLLPKLRK